MSNRPKWKSFVVLGSDNSRFKLGAPYCPAANCTMWAVPSPDESCARKGRAGGGTSPKVWVSIATRGQRSRPFGKSPLCSLIFKSDLLPANASKQPPVQYERRYGENLRDKQGVAET